MASQTSASNGASERSVIILDSPELSKYHSLRALTDFLDVIFDYAHKNYSPGKRLFPATVQRFEAGPQQLVDELGPDGFFVIMYEDTANGSSDGIKFIAAGGAKPYKSPKAGVTYGSETNMMFKRAPVAAGAVGEDDTNQSRWELISFGTDLKLQGQGLAGQITNLVVAEIRKRVDTAWHAEQLAVKDGGSRADRPKIVLLLSTIEELNEKYYQKRGWTTTAVKRIPVGHPLTVDGFGIVEMMKVWED